MIFRNELLKTVLVEQDPSKILSKYPKLQTEYIVFVVPFLIAFFLMFIICPITCCCCCCPGCCPPSCCRKALGEKYSKCELIWPSIVLILALGLILAGGAVGLTKAKDLQRTIEGIGCSVAITLDDIINGNETNGKFFAGIRTLSNKIGDISGSLTNIDTQFTNVVNSVNNVQTEFNTNLKVSYQNLPNGDGNIKSAFSYNTPFDAVTASGSVFSDFPVNLGTITGPGMLSNFWSILQGINDGVAEIGTNANNLKSKITDGSFNNAILSMSDIVDSVADTL